MSEPTIIDGKKIALQVRESIRVDVASRLADGHRAPGLATVLVGEDPASAVYIRSKRRAAAKIGIESIHQTLDKDTSEQVLLAHIDGLNKDPSVDGILVQLPLPAQIDEKKVISAIAPEKDVDGFHPENVAKLSLGLDGFVPCTPKGCLRLLREADVKLEGAHAVIVGRSNIVGKPMAQLLLAHNATVTMCHSRTSNLRDLTRQADILVAAVGRAHQFGADDLKEGAVVIDVGINRTDEGKLVGDVDTQAVMAMARSITPVPGGVGPMTIAMLMENTVLAHARNLGLPEQGIES